ncbi:MAG: hypothetical protein ACRDWA_11485 [Acidimicrobiia bacterium]
MADTPERRPSSEATTDAPPEQAQLDLAPSFAADDKREDSWSPLTTANTDYERLWSIPNGFSAQPESGAETPPLTPLPGSEEPETPPPLVLPSPPAATPGFTGTLVTGSEVLNASIVVGSGGIVLWGGGAEIGTWKHSQAKIARLTHARFAIQAEGETLTFTAEDPAGLDNAIAMAVKHGPTTEPSADEGLSPAIVVEPPILPPAKEPISSAPDPGAGVAPVRRPRIKNFRPETSEATFVPAAIPPDAPSEITSEVPEDDDGFTIADSVRASSDHRTVKARRFRPNDLRGIVIKSGVLLGVIAVLAGATYAVMVLMRPGDGEATATSQPAATAPPVTIVITTIPPVTVATTAPLSDTTFFQTDPSILTQRWNSLAEVAAPNMVLFSDITSPFILLLTPDVTLEGVLDPVAGNVTMRATPSGTPEGDGAILSALGILIGTADPTLDGGDRKALLGQLGLDVDRPELGGINGSLTHNGLAYRMVYQAEQNTLEFAITPEGATTTTTAS